MKKIVAGILGLLLFGSVLAQEVPKKDTLRFPKKSISKDTANTNPIFKGPAEIDSINKSEPAIKRKQSSPIDRYREDSIPKSPKKE